MPLLDQNPYQQMLQAQSLLRAPAAASGMSPEEIPTAPPMDIQAALMVLGQLLFGSKFLQPAPVDERVQEVAETYGMGGPMPMAGGLMGLSRGAQELGPDLLKSLRNIVQLQYGRRLPITVPKLNQALKPHLLEYAQNEAAYYGKPGEFAPSLEDAWEKLTGLFSRLPPRTQQALAKQIYRDQAKGVYGRVDDLMEEVIYNSEKGLSPDFKNLVRMVSELGFLK